MPFVAVHMAKGRPLEKRRRIAAAITDAISEILELEPGETQVLIHEHDRDNWAIGGVLLSERQPAQASGLPDLDSLFKAPSAKPVPKASAQKLKAAPRSRR
jgi:4-oxalocrotonate tautomerase